MKNIILLLVIILVSCGTRKVNKTEEKLEVKKKDTTEVVINSGKSGNTSVIETEKKEDNAEWNYNQGSLTPVDPDKPMTHTGPDGKTHTWTNTNVNFGSGSGKSAKSTETKTETKSATSDTSVVKVNTGAKEDIKKQSEAENIDRKGAATGVWFWIGIAIATCIIIWFIWFIIFKRKKSNELL